MKCWRENNLKNKIAIITGSSGDIGSSIVEQYLKDDFYVVGIDKKQMNEVSNKNFIHIKENLIQLTLGDNEAKRLINQITDNMPSKTDELVIVNNAAVQIVKSADDLTAEDWNESFGVNMIAPFILIKTIINQIAFNDCQIINIGSIHSNLTKSCFVSYAVSKSALEALTRSYAIELADRGISINAISPAAISTRMLQDGFSDKSKVKELESYHPTNSIGNTEDLSRFVKSITDQKDSFLTGSIIEYTGGIGSRLHDPS